MLIKVLTLMLISSAYAFKTSANMPSKKILLLSSSRLKENKQFLGYARQIVTNFLTGSNVTKITFIPYALKDQDKYTNTAREAFNEFGYELDSIHTSEDPATDILNAQAIFIGGGNTFLLLKTLYDKNLIEPIRKLVLENGIPYMGSSAGSNVACINICTTNDMPIIFPPSFNAFNFVPFNLNPHYLDPNPDASNMSETRDERINQYHELSGTPAVVGLREGSYLMINGDKVILHGVPGAKVFMAHREPVEYNDKSDLSHLLKQ